MVPTRSARHPAARQPAGPDTAGPASDPGGPGPAAAPTGPGPARTGAPADGPCAAGPGAVDADVAGAVGRTLEELLDARVAEAAAIDRTFAQDIAARVARFTLDGGKRTRSRFLWWGLRVCGGGRDGERAGAALRLGAALELIQTCALVHDDVMDGSALRRGRPSLHTALEERYGAGRTRTAAVGFAGSAAVLAGDLALSWADDIVAGTSLPEPVRLRTGAVWQAMRTEMVAGQYLDLHAQATGTRSLVRAVRTACLKSARYSVERPLELGAALAGADERTVRALRSAGRCAGLAFQLRDDLLGVFGDPDRTGKPVGDDIRDGKSTCLVALARSRADGESLAVLDAALGDPELTGSGLARVRSVLVETGARAAVEARIERLTELSARHLDTVPAEPGPRRRLEELLRAVAGPPGSPGHPGGDPSPAPGYGAAGGPGGGR
ncbi:polyprenyl synthetase family protein [Streptomyces sp. SP18CS02]|uniref:polyprenyl synthetase family protein n=1 Tax=Streptomyces sp. SP18CS02 TaxID=3002531 RepID=UPI002E78919D|nr:polyprenyl synthetase family protein [Streptomyces sp. SP18CS02]MEE1756641.1 polyprenyl synthetase family protein [Streptomyces sp. SP18CS02]